MGVPNKVFENNTERMIFLNRWNRDTSRLDGFIELIYLTYYKVNNPAFLNTISTIKLDMNDIKDSLTKNIISSNSLNFAVEANREFLSNKIAMEEAEIYRNGTNIQQTFTLDGFSKEVTVNKKISFNTSFELDAGTKLGVANLGIKVDAGFQQNYETTEKTTKTVTPLTIAVPSKKEICVNRTTKKDEWKVQGNLFVKAENLDKIDLSLTMVDKTGKRSQTESSLVDLKLILQTISTFSDFEKIFDQKKDVFIIKDEVKNMYVNVPYEKIIQTESIYIELKETGIET